MQVPKLHETDLKPWLNKLDMIEACATQTIKDLGLYGIELHFSGNPLTAYEELFHQIKPALEERLQRGSSVQEILYRVDVSETLVTQFLTANVDVAGGLTTLILWRELQKVVTRFLHQHHQESD